MIAQAVAWLHYSVVGPTFSHLFPRGPFHHEAFHETSPKTPQEQSNLLLLRQPNMAGGLKKV